LTVSQNCETVAFLTVSQNNKNTKNDKKLTGFKNIKSMKKVINIYHKNKLNNNNISK